VQLVNNPEGIVVIAQDSKQLLNDVTAVVLSNNPDGIADKDEQSLKQ